MAKLDSTKAPSQNFDLTKWKINVPMEDDKPEHAGKVMEISAQARRPRKPIFSP